MRDASDIAARVEGRGPAWRRAAGMARAATAAATVALSFLWVLDVPRLFGVTLFREQFLSAVMAFAVASVLLAAVVRPSVGAAGRVLALLVLPVYVSAFVYVGFNYEDLILELAFGEPRVIAIGVILIVAVCDVVLRTAGLGLFSVVIASLAVVFLPSRLMDAMGLRSASAADALPYLALDPGSMFGPPLAIGAIVVPAFILFGHAMFSTRGGDFLLDFSLRLMGAFRGGAAKVAVVASTFFGSISGSAVSNVVSTGVLTIPLMRRTGYRPAEAAAVEAVASTGGQLMPPVMGAAVFIMAEFLQIDYTEILLAALVPALLYYLSLFVIIDRIGAFRAAGRITTTERVTFRFLLTGSHFFVAIAILLVAMLPLRLAPEAAALSSAAFLFATTLLVVARSLDRALFFKLVRAPVDAGLTLVPLLCILAGAGLVAGAINFTGVAFNISLFLLELAGGNLFVLLLLAALACIILGMGMPTTGVYVLLATLIAPSLVRLGVEPMAAHLFILYFGMMSMLTPPIALAAFAAASLVDERPFRVALLASGFGWAAYVVPFAFVYDPALILQGGFGEIAVAVVAMAGAVWLVSSAAVGPGGIASWGGRLARLVVGVLLIAVAVAI